MAIPALVWFVLAAGYVQQATARLETFSRIQLHELDVSDLRRDYYLYLPPVYRSSEDLLPLVVVLHGGGKGDGLSLEKNTEWASLAEKEGFITVYPNGIDGNWNDGRGITYKGNNVSDIDDVKYISELIDHLVRTYRVDNRLIYVTGLSNGGMMTLRLGCEISSQLAAIAPVISSFPKNILDRCRPQSPLSVLLMNGTEDPLVPYSGGHVRFLFRKMGAVVSTKETVAFWVKQNNCDVDPVVRRLPDLDHTDHSSVTVVTYTNEKSRNEVVLYKIEGGGHTLPGSNIPDRPLIIGHKNKDINGVEEIWAFFKKHSS